MTFLHARRLIVVASVALGLGGASSFGTAVPEEAIDLAERRSAGVTEDWWNAVQRDLTQSEYRIGEAPSNPVDCGDAYQAPNRAQNFHTSFTAQGIRVQPRKDRGEAPAWEWGLSLVGWGREGSPVVPSSRPTMQVNGNRIEYVRDDLVEWYVNDARGLEQGFTIARAPASDVALDKPALLQDPGIADRSNAANQAQPSADRKGLRVDLEVSGTLKAVVSGDGEGVDFLAPEGARAIQFDHLLVVDAHGVRLPAWFECSDHPLEASDEEQSLKPSNDSSNEREKRLLSIVVNDCGAEYPITIDPLATSPNWSAESNQAGAHFGISVATAGDVNGDGFSDVIVGAFSYDNGEENEGRVFVYEGSAAGLGLSPAWTAESDQASARFGVSVATAGDVNGDGFSDVIVGAFSYDNGQENEGKVFVYEGSSEGLEPFPAWTAESDQADAQFGFSVSTAGDVNGDGFSDVIIGSRHFDNGQNDEGRALLYEGSSDGLELSPAWTAESDQADAWFGVSVATAGDVNGDGYSDVIVGARLYDNGQVDEGRVFVYEGSVAGLAPSPAWTAESDQAGALFGVAVATAGDVNGDGLSDVIVGAHFYESGENNEGRAFLFKGAVGGLELSPSWTAESDQADGLFGVSVSPAGDVNGDGYADVVVGAEGYDSGQTNEGRAFFYFGSAVGLSPSFAWAEESNQVDASLGGSVATAGDVNGDGYSDVIVGAYGADQGEIDEGRAFVYLGSAAGGPPVTAGWSAESDQAAASFGFAVATAGDVNGDGFGDMIVGAPLFNNGQSGEGRVYVYHGSASGLSITPAWTAESDHVNGEFGTSVATAGDVNGDGFSDVIVGAPKCDNGDVDEGWVFVYHGSPVGLAPTPAWTAEGDQADARFGTSAATAGDVNGDGFSDVIVGAWLYDNGQVSEGRAYVYHGSSSGLSVTSGWTAESDKAGAWFGWSVAGAGDVNGDGFSDVIVGAPSFDTGAGLQEYGRAFVYYGSASGLSLSFAWTETGTHAEAFGYSVATAGDVNGDGFSDVIIGAKNYAEVYHGSAAGLYGPQWEDWFSQNDSPIGSSVSTAGDVNRDGFSDVIVGVDADPLDTGEGRAYVFHGSEGGLNFNSSWAAEGPPGAAFGHSVATAGDVNNDGLSDVVVGAKFFNNGQPREGRAFLYCDGGSKSTHPRQLRTDGMTPIQHLGRSDSETEFRISCGTHSIYGRTRLQVEHEVKPFGVLFDGTSTASGALEDIGEDGEIDVDRLVSGLTADTQYHWRVRAQYDLSKTPFQRYGPWVHAPINGWNEADLRTGIADPASAPQNGIDAPFILRAAGSNPGRGHCEVLLTLNRASSIDATVIDVQGRTIAVLRQNASFEAGSHVLTWDGRDQSGTSASGIYFISVRADGQVGAQKVVLSRR